MNIFRNVKRSGDRSIWPVYYISENANKEERYIVDFFMLRSIHFFLKDFERQPVPLMRSDKTQIFNELSYPSEDIQDIDNL